MWTALLWTNVIQGLVALAWVTGARRFLSPLPAASAVRLLTLALILPLLLSFARWLGWDGLPERWSLIRVSRWMHAAERAGLPALLASTTLLAGVALIFLVQEVSPFLLRRRGASEREAELDPRLSGSRDRVARALVRAGFVSAEHELPPALRSFSLVRTAAIRGLRRPRVVVSQGLLESLDDDELDAVLAHELAHHVRGGNRRLLALWVLRTLQATSPAAMLLFRSLLAQEERACDAVAVQALATPAALASALLKAQPGRPGTMTPLDQLLWRAERSLARSRARALLEAPPPLPLSLFRSALAPAALLMCLLGAIG